MEEDKEEELQQVAAKQISTDAAILPVLTFTHRK